MGECRTLLAETGFTGIAIDFTHEVADGLHGAIVAAIKPARAPGVLVAANPTQGKPGCR